MFGFVPAHVQLGNPLSAWIAYHLLVAPTLRLLSASRLSAQAQHECRVDAHLPPVIPVRLLSPVMSDPVRPVYILCVVYCDNQRNGGVAAIVTDERQQSSRLLSTQDANALVRVESSSVTGEAGIAAGSVVKVFLLAKPLLHAPDTQVSMTAHVACRCSSSRAGGSPAISRVSSKVDQYQILPATRYTISNIPQVARLAITRQHTPQISFPLSSPPIAFLDFPVGVLIVSDSVHGGKKADGVATAARQSLLEIGVENTDHMTDGITSLISGTADPSDSSSWTADGFVELPHADRSVPAAHRRPAGRPPLSRVARNNASSAPDLPAAATSAFKSNEPSLAPEPRVQVRLVLARCPFAVVVPDDPSAIRLAVLTQLLQHGNRVLLVAGGSGLSPRDRTAEALGPLFAKPLPGLSWHLSTQSLKKTSFAALSNISAGLVEVPSAASTTCAPSTLPRSPNASSQAAVSDLPDGTMDADQTADFSRLRASGRLTEARKYSLVIGLPGSPKAVAECVSALGNGILQHAVAICATQEIQELERNMSGGRSDGFSEDSHHTFGHSGF
eukprot:GHVT01077327.1.p1 GENE.GHVT01077327.1~~GHVT01077327.1.p1  ORF type:complete len:559 (-),score=45.24 GHVT01077327.1:534-2210(-)